MARTTIGSESLNSGRLKINAMTAELYSLLGGSSLVLHTSLSDAVDDADISLGSTSFGTDSTTAIQGLLDMAELQPIILVVDGHYSVTGLDIWANTTILFRPGCGFILRDHSNRPVFRNKNQKVVGEAIVDENITLYGYGGIINGNGYNTGATGNDVFDVANNGSAVNGSAQIKRVPIIEFFGVRNLELSGIQLLGGRYWASVGGVLDHAVYNNIFIDFGDSSSRDDYNYDGLHFKGDSHHIRMSDIIIEGAKDDNIALNAHAQLSIYEPYIGPITDVSIENVHINSIAMGIGIYSETSTSRIDNVRIKGLYGTTRSHAIRITNGENVSPDGNGAFGTIVIEDIEVAVLSGSIVQNYDAKVNIRGTIDKLIFRNLSRRDFTNSISYIRLSGGSDAVINQLIIDGVALETTGGSFSKPFLQVSTGSIRNCIINNYIHEELTSGINSPIVLVDGGSIDTLDIGRVITKNINSLVTVSSGSIGSIKPTHIGSVEFAALPSASLWEGSIAYVTDESDGPTEAFSDGANWIDVRDGSAVTGP